MITCFYYSWYFPLKLIIAIKLRAQEDFYKYHYIYMIHKSLLSYISANKIILVITVLESLGLIACKQVSLTVVIVTIAQQTPHLLLWC